MASTNHNLWTLTKNVAHSVNKTAGKIDVIVYGDKTNAVVQVKTVPLPSKAVPQQAKAIVEVPKAPEKPRDPLAPSPLGVTVLAIALIVSGLVWFMKFRK